MNAYESTDWAGKERKDLNTGQTSWTQKGDLNLSY